MIKKILIGLLRKVADDLEADNTNLTEKEMLGIVDEINEMNDDAKYMSKYKACEYLHVSRATFDRLVADGKIPQGKKRVGFKELSWSKKELKLIE